MKELQKKFEKWNSSAALFAVLLFGIFCVMLLGNMLSLRYADDFEYLYSFADGSRIDSVSALLSSIRAHYFTMNGRLVAHTFVQIFEALPKTIFNVINAGMFTFSVYLIYKLCTQERKRNNFFLLALFSVIWIYEPGFGEVNFWLDGACNYLWAQVFAFAFLLPFVHLYLERESLLDKGHVPKKIVFCVLSVLMGAYLEALSGAMIFMAIVFMCIVRFVQKRKVPVFAVVSVCMAFCAYLTMIFAPAEIEHKTNSFSFLRRMYQLEKVTDRFHTFGALIVAFIILCFVAVSCKVGKKLLGLSAVFALGSFGSGMIFLLTNYYPSRCVSTPMLLAAIADGILLLAVLEETKYRRAAWCLMTILCVSLLYWCPHGMKDIFFMYEAEKENITLIEEQKASGETNLSVPILVPDSKYTAFEGLVYLSPDNPEHFSNLFMAKYYGVDSILGVETE